MNSTANADKNIGTPGGREIGAQALMREPRVGHWTRAEWERLRDELKALHAELDQLDPAHVASSSIPR